MKTVTKIKFTLVLVIFSSSFYIFIYKFDKIVTPTVLAVADSEMRAKCIEIINNQIIEEYSKNFDYSSIIQIEKDNSGNIVLLKADTLKLNKIASTVAIQSQKDLKALGNVGISLPMGYIFRNNILAYFGPNIPIKMHPIGNIETKYASVFESAGINQTRHKIYVEVKTNVRVILPTKSNDIEVKNEIPICETIIVGKIPNTSINLDMQRSGVQMSN